MGKLRKDLSGKRFFRLKVLEFDKFVTQGSNKVAKFLCKCDCGNIKSIKGTHLSRGDTKSCGCYKPNKLPIGEAAFNSVYNNYKRNAKNRKLEWDISKEKVKKITSENCYYCNQTAKNKHKNYRGNGYYTYNGIDRINNAKGYIATNIVPCCKICNWMKLHLSKKEFIKHIRRIYGFRANKG